MRNGATPTPKTTGPCLADFFLRMDDVGLWRGQENKRKTHGKMHQDDAQCTIYVGFSENEVTHSNPKSYGFKKIMFTMVIFVDRAHFQTHPSSSMVGVHHFRQPVQVIHRSPRVGGLSQFTCDSHWAIQTSHNHK